jgi:hypothetical protein
MKTYWHLLYDIHGQFRQYVQMTPKQISKKNADINH